jgi:hypothetical protein
MARWRLQLRWILQTLVMLPVGLYFLGLALTMETDPRAGQLSGWIDRGLVGAVGSMILCVEAWLWERRLAERK